MFRRILALSFSMICSGPLLSAQELGKEDQSKLLFAAKGRYYNLTSLGVKAFSCDVSMDWNALFQSAGGTTLPEGDPFLAYLNKAKLTFTDDLTGTPKIEWVPQGEPPPEKQSAADQLKGGLIQLLGGFFQTWNGSLNGELVPLHPQTMTSDADGYKIREQTADTDTTISYDKTMLIKHLGGQAGPVNSQMDATFTDSPKGLLLTRMDAVVILSAGTSPVKTQMDTSFTAVDGVQIPTGLTVHMQNLANFRLKFSGCTIQRQSETEKGLPVGPK
jgi:hypothetical protein